MRFVPKFEPPAGTPIAIELVWKSDGKTNRVDARQWVKDEKTKKPLAHGWVFAGSELFQDAVTKKMIYAADEGDLITVANFGSAILDLPFASSASDADRVFSADPARVAPTGTEVFLMLAPAPGPAARRSPDRRRTYLFDPQGTPDAEGMELGVGGSLFQPLPLLGRPDQEPRRMTVDPPAIGAG